MVDEETGGKTNYTKDDLLPENRTRIQNETNDEEKPQQN